MRAAVTREDRAIFERASQALREKRHREAWALAEPLFGKYPNDYAVQELRCSIATRLSLDWEETRSHCQPMISLTPGVPKSFR